MGPEQVCTSRHAQWQAEQDREGLVVPLEKAIDSLAEALAKLYERLGPVLTPEEDRTATLERINEIGRSSSPLRDNLTRLNDKVDDLRHRVVSVTGAVDL